MKDKLALVVDLLVYHKKRRVREAGQTIYTAIGNLRLDVTRLNEELRACRKRLAEKTRRLCILEDNNDHA